MQEYRFSMQVSLEKGGFPKQDALTAHLHTTLLDPAVFRIQLNYSQTLVQGLSPKFLR